MYSLALYFTLTILFLKIIKRLPLYKDKVIEIFWKYIPNQQLKDCASK